MAHIPDGVLAIPVLCLGAGVTVIGVGLALKRAELSELPKIAMASAVFFTVSAISIPVGLSGTHLVLSALLGITLGLQVFPALLVGLLLQALLAGHGGILSLGVNVANLALPALTAGLIFKKFAKIGSAPFWAAGLAAASIFATSGMIGLSLYASSSDYAYASAAAIVAHLPLALVEAVITFAAIRFLLARNSPWLPLKKGETPCAA